MQTNSILVSLLASSLATAAVKPHTLPEECTVPAVAYTPPAYSKPTISSMTFEQYGSPSAPSVASASSYYPKPAEYTPSSSHATVKVFETTGCTTGCTTATYSDKSGMHTATSYKPSTTSTYKTTTSATPTHNMVENVAGRMNVPGVIAATVVAGLFFFM